MTVCDEGLFAGQAKAVAGALGFERGALGPVMRAFVDRERRDQPAFDDCGQPSPALIAARRAERRDRADGGCEKGRGREVAPDLFEDDAGLDMAEAAAALGFGDEDAGKTHLAEGGPKLAREAGRIVRVS